MFRIQKYLSPSTRSTRLVSSTPMAQERLSREEAVMILRSTASYLEGRAAVAQNAAREYRLRALASRYRTRAQEQSGIYD